MDNVVISNQILGGLSKLDLTLICRSLEVRDAHCAAGSGSAI